MGNSNFKLPRLSSINSTSNSLLFSTNAESDDIEDNSSTADQINLAISNDTAASTTDTTATDGISVTISPSDAGLYGSVVLGTDGSKTISLNVTVSGPDDLIDYEVRWAELL